MDSLIHDLGDESYQVRERATEELGNLSEAEIPLLEKAVESGDPEVRVRARKIVEQLRLGIRPDWPPELVQLVQDYHGLDSSARIQALSTLDGALKEKAAPFLISCTASSDEAEAGAALELLRKLMNDHRAVAERIVRLLKKPTRNTQRKTLAWALSCMGNTPEALQKLAGVDSKDNIRSELYEQGVKGLIALQKDAQFEKMSEDAGQLADAAPLEARFLYLEAEALVSLGKGNEAKKLRKKALALHPDEEAPHYAAGEMLGEIGRKHLATREWETILNIPPVDEVYDINAHLRLSDILSKNEEFQQAANHLEKAINLSKAQRLFMIGADEKTIQERLQSLRQQAAQQKEPAPDEKDEKADLHMNIRFEVKDGKLKEMNDAVKQADRVLNLNVKPLGVRILDLPNTSLHYDAGNKQLLLLLNKQPCENPLPLEIKGRQARIAVHSLDCTYVFEITAASGDVKLIARYEKNYVIQFVPKGLSKDLTQVEATINDQPYDWEDMREGIRFDFLSETLDVKISGTDSSKQPQTIKCKIKIPSPGKSPLKPADGKD